jgi:hypothetical protein
VLVLYIGEGYTGYVGNRHIVISIRFIFCFWCLNTRCEFGRRHYYHTQENNVRRVVSRGHSVDVVDSTSWTRSQGEKEKEKERQ